LRDELVFRAPFEVSDGPINIPHRKMRAILKTTQHGTCCWEVGGKDTDHISPYKWIELMYEPECRCRLWLPKQEKRVRLASGQVQGEVAGRFGKHWRYPWKLYSGSSKGTAIIFYRITGCNKPRKHCAAGRCYLETMMRIGPRSDTSIYTLNKETF